jgi:hypothetical protein
MHKLNRPIFYLFIFIFFFTTLNIFILILLDNISVVSSFFTMYLFWFLMIIVLFIISRNLSKIQFDEDNDV